MTDHHIHIGQWYETYYEPREVFEAVHAAGVTRIKFSSTTSCVDNVKYSDVEKEVESAFNSVDNLTQGTFTSSGSPSWGVLHLDAFLWFVPDYVKQGVTIEAAMDAVPYSGIKIHPRAQNWDLNDVAMRDLAHRIFDYAHNNRRLVLIHTGDDAFEAPDKFSAFFGEYKNAKIILAHGRPADKTIEMMRKYSNVYCDTAFMGEEVLKKIIDAGFASRVLPGSDFPITHYGNAAPLREQYREDALKLQRTASMIEEALSNLAQRRA